MVSGGNQPIVSLVAVVCVSLLLEVPAGAQQASAPFVEASGYYLPVATTTEFQSVQWVELWAEDVGGKPTVLTGSIRLTNEAMPTRFENRKLASVTLIGNRLSFRSRTKGGVSYQFTGRFLKGGDLSELNPSQEPVLRGEMAKVANQRVLAKSDVEFFYRVGD